jgi:DNA-binding transcriptional MerR regulator
MYYTVCEAAKIANMTLYTLRYYAREGLLPFLERTSGGIRMFKDVDFEWLYIINTLKKSGMMVKEIRDYIGLCAEGDSTIGQRLEVFKKQQKILETRIAEFQETLEVVKYKRWRYEISNAAGTINVHKTMKPEETPGLFRLSCEIMEKRVK